MAKYKIGQIRIGDEIIYRYKHKTSGYPNWKVVSKIDKSLLVIEIKKEGIDERRIIDIEDVKELVIGLKQ
jgi:hypothetical protein